MTDADTRALTTLILSGLTGVPAVVLLGWLSLPLPFSAVAYGGVLLMWLGTVGAARQLLRRPD